MQGNDLALWSTDRTIIVLEGVLVNIPRPKKKLIGKPDPISSDEWLWSELAVKSLNSLAVRFNATIDVVTFTSEDVAEQAAQWFDRYEVRVSSCEYVEYKTFCQSLHWRPDVIRVVDSDQGRLHNFGVRAYETAFGGEF